MKRIALAALILALASPALAQEQPSTDPRTLSDRIGAQIGALVIQNAGHPMLIEQFQARVKELEAKKPDVK